MGLPFKESKVIAGLYVRHFCNRVYIVTHGNAVFAGESHIRFTPGQVMTVPGSGEWTIYALPNLHPSDSALGLMIVYVNRTEDVPSEAAIITELSAD